MKKKFLKSLLSFSFIFSFCLVSFELEANTQPLKSFNKPTLEQMYEYHCTYDATHCDIYEHIPVLKDYASKCSSVTEIGIRYLVSTWGVLQGLANNPYSERRYCGIDIAAPPPDKIYLANQLATEHQIDFQFIQANDMDIEIEPTDMLFIDSLHTYCHLTYELETFSPSVGKYICLHDTSAPFDHQEDYFYEGDYSEYPSWYDRTKKGLWPAVEDFLARHPEWVLLERRTNNHGFTVLKRASLIE